MKAIALGVVTICGALLIYVSLSFPAWGDKHTPASTHVSPHYIEKGLSETAVPNIVSAVLADYRGYDTMLETTVILIAGIVCFFLLRTFNVTEKDKSQYVRHKPTNLVLKIEKGGKVPTDHPNFELIDSNWAPYDLIIKTTVRLLIPFIQIFALYVIAHGHHSPGGGFQGGVILGATFILYAISNDLRGAKSRITEKTSGILSATGVLIYVGIGTICMLLGSMFLDYSALAPILGGNTVMARSHGILFIEVGVGLAVMAVMIWLYYNISSRGKHEEGL